MPLPHFHHGIKLKLNEEKYQNEKRRLILENLFCEREIDFDYLEKMKNDFTERVWDDCYEPIYKN